MSAGFRSALPPLGGSAGGAPATGGFRSMLAFWAGGASLSASADAASTPGKVRNPRRHRWTVWTEEGYRHFDTANEAHAFLYPEEKPEETRKTKAIPRARTLGKVTYAGQDISEIRIEGKPGDEVFRMGDMILARAIQKRIEQQIERIAYEHAIEDEAIAILMLAM